MIQRVQSLFLAGVAICLAAALFFPIWQKIDPESHTGVVLKAMHTEVHSAEEPVKLELFPTVFLGILACAGIVVAVIEIFQYRNRLSQMKLGALNSLIMAGFMGLSVYFTFRMEKMISIAGEGTYDLGMYLPAAALICNLLANRFIRKDEALVRSVDRIR
jgi:drug/metabolite transporter (DMT)-like permease